MLSIEQVRHRATRAPGTIVLCALLFLAGAGQWLWWGESEAPQPVQETEHLPQLTNWLAGWVAGWIRSWPLGCKAALNGEWWRLCFYPLYHRTALCGLLGGLSVYLLGRSIEPVIGSLRLAFILVVSVVGGGIAQCTSTLLGAASPDAMDGAGPPICALLGIYGTLIPDWPVGGTSGWVRNKVRARHLYWCAAWGPLLIWATGWGPEFGPVAMASAAVLAGGLTGWMGYGGTPRKSRFGDRANLPEGVQYSAPHNARIWDDIPILTWNDFVRFELDPILEKISKSGMASLTPAELRKLRSWPPFPGNPP